jgi:uncharacterized membrane protein
MFSLFALGLVTTAPAQANADYTFTSFDFPGATYTKAQKINSNGDIVGFYEDASGDQYGFLLKGGVYTSIHYPNAIQTSALGINDKDSIVGEFEDSKGKNHGFLLSN